MLSMRSTEYSYVCYIYMDKDTKTNGVVAVTIILGGGSNPHHSSTSTKNFICKSGWCIWDLNNIYVEIHYKTMFLDLYSIDIYLSSYVYCVCSEKRILQIGRNCGGSSSSILESKTWSDLTIKLIFMTSREKRNTMYA